METRRFNRAKVFWTRCIRQNKLKVSAPIDLMSRWMVEHNGGYLVLKPGTSFLNTGFKQYFNIGALPNGVMKPVQNPRYWYDRCVKHQTILPASIKTDKGYMQFTVEGNRLVFHREQRMHPREFALKLNGVRSYEESALARMPEVVAVGVLPPFSLLPELGNVYWLGTRDKKFNTATKLSMSMPNINDKYIVTKVDIDGRDELLQDSAELYDLMADNCMDFTLYHDCVFYILVKSPAKFVIHKISKHHERPRATLHHVCLWVAKTGNYSLLYSMQLQHLLALTGKLDEYLSTPDKTQSRQHVVTRTFDLNSEI